MHFCNNNIHILLFTKLISSHLFHDQSKIVGPESAGAHPGPVCYRKNGHLAVTDANLVLGRVLPEQFPKIFGPNENEALDSDGARSAFEELEQLPSQNK